MRASNSGLTSRPVPEWGLDMFTMLKLIEARGYTIEEAPPEVLLTAAQETRQQPPDRLRCLNPTCDQICAWTGGKGRPPLFCSKICRQQHERMRQRLEAEVAELSRGIDSCPPGGVLKRELSSERSKRVFALARYPDVRDHRAIRTLE